MSVTMRGGAHFIYDCRQYPQKRSPIKGKWFDRQRRAGALRCQLLAKYRRAVLSICAREFCSGRLESRSRPLPTARAGTTERNPAKSLGGLLVYFALAHASLDGGLSPPLLTAVT